MEDQDCDGLPPVHSGYLGTVLDTDQADRVYADVLVEVCRQRTLLQSDALDGRLKFDLIEQWQKRASAIKAVYSSQPYVIMTNVPYFRSHLGAVGLLFLGYSVWVLHSLTILGMPTYDYYKLTAQERRDNTTMAWQRRSGPGVSRFGLLTHENSGVYQCKPEPISNLTITPEDDMILFFHDAKKNNNLAGWYVVTAKEPDSIRDDPVRFQLLGSSNRDGPWTLVSTPHFSNYGSRNLFWDMRFDMPKERDLQVKWYLTAPWAAYPSYFGVWAVYAWLLLCSFVLSLFRKTWYIQRHIFYSFLGMGLTCMIGGLGFTTISAEGGSLQANMNNLLYFIVIGLVYMCFSVIHITIPRIPEVILCGAGLFSLIAQLSSGGSVLSIQAIASTTIPVVTGIIIFVIRFRVVTTAKAKCMRQKQLFDQEWTKILAEQGGINNSLMLLLRLNTAVSDIAMRVESTKEARQFNVCIKDGKFHAIKESQLTNARNNSVAPNAGNTSNIIPELHYEPDGAETQEMDAGQPWPSAQALQLEVEISPPPSWHDEVPGIMRTESPIQGQNPPPKFSGTLVSRQLKVRNSSILETMVLDESSLHGARKHSKLPQVSKNWKHNFAGVDWEYGEVLRTVSRKHKFVSDWSSPITSLDQLYAQATLVHCILFPKVIAYAAAHNGQFRLRGKPGQFARCTDPYAKDINSVFKFGGIKDVFRCIDKIDMSYGGDVSRLLDVCREMIIFDNVSDLTSCLTAMGKDKSIKIVRIRSTMCEAGDRPAVLTGFRFVSINIQIQNEQTFNLCVDRHVSEVLLVLKKFATIITPNMHSNYVWYRHCASSYLWLKTVSVPSANIDIDAMNELGYESDQEFGPMPYPNSSRPNTASTGSYMARPETGGSTQRVAPHPNEEPSGLTLEAVAGGHLRTGHGSSSGRFPQDSQSRSLLEGCSGVDVLQVEDFGKFDSDVIAPIGSQREANFTSNGGSSSGNEAQPAVKQGWTTSWGVTIDDEIMLVLELICKMSAVGYSHLLGQSMSMSHSLALDTVPITNIFFVTMPLLLVVTKRKVCNLILCGGVLMICIMLWSGLCQFFQVPGFSTLYWKFQGNQYRHYRFQNVLARNFTRATSPGIADFGVVITKKKEDCNVLADNGSLESLDGTGKRVPHYTMLVTETNIFQSFEHNVAFYGWYLALGAGMFSDSSKFQVFAAKTDTNDPLLVPPADWIEVGASQWMYSSLDGYVLHNVVRLPEETMTMVFQPAQTAYKVWQLRYLNLGFFLILFSVFGKLHMTTYALISLRIMACINVVLGYYQGVDRGYLRNGTNAFIFTEVAIGVLWFACFVKERYARIFMVFIMSCMAIDTLLDMVMPISLSGPSTIDVPYLIAMIVIPTMAFPLWIANLVSHKVSSKLVAEDRAKFDALWRSIVQDDTGLASIKHLGEIVRMFGLDDLHNSNMVEGQATSMPVNQLSRFLCAWRTGQDVKTTHLAPKITRDRVLGADKLFKSLNILPVPGTLSRKIPVKSLDQLFMQALIANTLLLRKIKRWAKETEGYFPLKTKHNSGYFMADDNGGLFVKWIEAENDPEVASMIKWAALKNYRRAIEKLMRVYDSDVSRLVDISRHCIYFDNLGDLAMCMGKIVTDIDTKVDRVKSSFNPTYDAAVTAGYRGVVLNVRVDDAAARMLGCESHLCEIQLTLRKFGELKTAEGHRRYIQIRDARA